jgi:glucokinase
LVFLGIDIGGTYIKYASKLNGEIIKDKIYVRDIVENGNLEEFINKLKSLIKNYNPDRIGIAVAGLVDKKEGKITNSPNLKFLENLPLKEILENFTKKPVYVENDASLAALGEYRYGAGKGKNIVLCLTLGTGLGGGAVINGQLLTGVSGSAMEVGHTTIVKNGWLCHCGRKGCLEAYVSSYGLERIYFMHTHKFLDSKEIIAEANEGKVEAINSIEEFSKYLSIGLMNLTHLFNPDCIILSGGIPEHYPLITELAISDLKHIVFPLPFRDLEIKKAELGEFSGSYGALELAEKGGITV